MKKLVLMFLCAAFGATVQAQQAREAVGIVSEYRPVQDRFSITGPARQISVPLTIGTQVYAGDTVELPGNGVVLVTGADGKTSEISGPGIRELAPASAKGLGVFGLVLASVQEYFGEPYRTSRIAAAQGSQHCTGAGEIDVPLFPDGIAVVAGTRDLRFAWKGGCAPFTVVVRDAAAREIARSIVSSRAVRFPEAVLPPGRVEVEITGGGESRRLAIEAAASKPSPPAELRPDGNSDGLALLAEAYWLAEQDQGRWRFESFDLLAPQIRAGDPLAGKVGDLLLWGPGGAPP